jgi:NAD-dependent SIR2 family protein deacetylase
MAKHNQETQHDLAISLSDLNIWCYSCDSYVLTYHLQSMYKTFHLAKFGTVPGENLGLETIAGHAKRSVEEKEESEESIKTKVKTLAQWVRDSKHCVIFTGAGISTSASIPDFRGPNGVWTLKEKGLQPDSIRLEQATPTPCHMAIVALLNHFKASNRTLYVISQNIDGLHLRSGINRKDISELHGNSFKDICWNCSKEYLRTFDAAEQSGQGGIGCDVCLKRVPKFCHCTERKCECGSVLKDSIIHFGENLPQDALTAATKHSSNADLIIVLGSSLTVAPANEMPKKTQKNKGNFCLVNLQSTSYDDITDLRIFAKTDIFVTLLMKELGIPIPEFDLSQFFMEPNLK